MFSDWLEKRKRDDLFRECRILESAQGAVVRYQGRDLVLMGSNNYLGLNGHPDLVAAGNQAQSTYGTGAGGSRLTTGTLTLHDQVEKRIASLKGTEAALGVSHLVDIQVGTLSKAVPSVGGYVAGSQYLIDYLQNTARSFIYSTALPPSALAVSLAAIDLVEAADEKRSSLMEKAQWLGQQLQKIGFEVLPVESPIVVALVGDPDRALKLSQGLLDAGIYVPAIRPPTVPKGTSRLRFSLMADHSQDHLTQVLSTLRALTTGESGAS